MNSHGFYIWYPREPEFSNKNRFDVDYKWFSYIYDGFGLEHIEN
jgi:hypothetical protein